ncbi:uncharacterized protein [Physcomitrium patens]|uniref:uncharacterized protein isoform X2 n=1 Tax=Physcomitrium patens TaxID=3218 RepID=UPI000D17E583|nr:transmembrane protein 50 homolog isoform X2 [Physcomitrium patens]|eukprot:XP_024365587.1 transmembrane protein 50 homolog isoform X2 [Physcomitrella patens]
MRCQFWVLGEILFETSGRTDLESSGRLGIFATIAALMVNGVRRDELTDYSPFDDNDGCRSRTWLFLAYVIAFTSLAGSVGMLVQDALLPTTPSTWTGIAGVLQCFFVLSSGLMYWTSRASSDY